MPNIRERCPLSGMKIKTKPGVGKGLQGEDLGEKDFVVEDWWENVYGQSWMTSNGNPAAFEYASRIGFSEHFPSIFSNDVVYGKIDGLGHIFHVVELDLEEDLQCLVTL